MNDTVLALVILLFTKLQALKGCWIKLETPSLCNYFYVPLVLGRAASSFGWDLSSRMRFLCLHVKHQTLLPEEVSNTMFTPVTANAEGLIFNRVHKRLWLGTVHSDDSMGEEKISVYFCLLSKDFPDKGNSSMLREMRKVVTQVETAGNLEAGL